ncbi:MAG: TetR/AcrR family transcriptional regulator [Methylobacteriaceae bacterium]|nr:TetR/AcrR family transcriptional regulator [Methylobacteriaceae bacterium]
MQDVLESEITGDINLPLPGVAPARQKRSRETMAGLLAAGERLLKTNSLEELSIESLCAEFGATVGAFYSRFESKEAYFRALQLMAARRGTARFAALRESGALARADLPELCRLFAASAAAWFRENEGVLRASLQHNSTHPERWSDFKELGRRFVAESMPALLARMGPGKRAAQTQNIAFAFQVMFGTLVNAVLNDPGPVGLNDRQLPQRLAQTLVLILESGSGNAKRA